MTLIALLVGAAIIAAVQQPIGIAVVAGALLLIVPIIGIELGPIAGALVGLAAGGATVAMSRALGTWGPDAYLPMVALVCAMVAAGHLGGRLGRSIKALARNTHQADLRPANGSLGLLHHAAGEDRLAEEVERAAFGGTPLTVLWIQGRTFGDWSAQPDRGRILRVISRTLESLLAPIHLPFAYDDANIVAILPMSDAADAGRLVERLRRACAEATVLVGADRDRIRFSQVGAVDVGLGRHPADGTTATALLDAAREDLRAAGSERHVALTPVMDLADPRPASRPAPLTAGVVASTTAHLERETTPLRR